MTTCSQHQPHSIRKPLRKSILLPVLFVAMLSQLSLPLPAQTPAASEPTQQKQLSPLPAQEKATMIGMGYASILDTYLSQEKYVGSDLRIISQKRKPWRQFMQTFINEGTLSFVNNRADNNDELGGMYHFSYHLRRFWQLTPTLSLEAGGGIGAQVGVLYNTRNSNNPAQAYASVQLLPSAAVTKQVQLLSRTSYLRYELSIPVAGLMFSPNYGQSYYEIFSRGNYDHNIVPTTIAATPSLRHMLTFDFPLSRRKPQSMLRIGYLGDYQQAKVNNLKQHHISHLLVLGWTITR